MALKFVPSIIKRMKNGKNCLDATITYHGDINEVGVYAHEYELSLKYFKFYAPSSGDKFHTPFKVSFVTILCQH